MNKVAAIEAVRYCHSFQICGVEELIAIPQGWVLKICRHRINVRKHLELPVKSHASRHTHSGARSFISATAEPVKQTHDLLPSNRVTVQTRPRSARQEALARQSPKPSRGVFSLDALMNQFGTRMGFRQWGDSERLPYPRHGSRFRRPLWGGSHELGRSNVNPEPSPPANPARWRRSARRRAPRSTTRRPAAPIDRWSP